MALQGLALCLNFAAYKGSEWPHQQPVALLEMQVAIWWEFRHPEQLIVPWPGIGGGLPNGSQRPREIVLSLNILPEQEGTLNGTGSAFPCYQAEEGEKQRSSPSRDNGSFMWNVYFRGDQYAVGWDGCWGCRVPQAPAG